MLLVLTANLTVAAFSYKICPTLGLGMEVPTRWQNHLNNSDFQKVDKSNHIFQLNLLYDRLRELQGQLNFTFNKFVSKYDNNFVNEYHLLTWGKLQLGLIRSTAREPSIYAIPVIPLLG